MLVTRSSKRHARLKLSSPHRSEIFYRRSSVSICTLNDKEAQSACNASNVLCAISVARSIVVDKALK